MKPPFGQQLDTLARRLTPAAVTLGLVLLAAMPVHVPGFAQVMPLLPLVGVYHWTLYRPDLMPARAVFLIGLFHDAIGGGPIGFYAAIFLIAHGVTLSQARFFVAKGFAVLWFGFAAVAAGAAVLAWATAMLFYGTLPGVWAPLFQYALTVGVFPFLSRLFLRWQQGLLAQV